uniref:(California timema) hypothetical protein n=1 Tax=Timema californicum TaxID=61474 RepID=A0A7R9PD87_TIMCA|nr:unnamed protein product [Timema californicum]
MKRLQSITPSADPIEPVVDDRSESQRRHNFPLIPRRVKEEDPKLGAMSVLPIAWREGNKSQRINGVFDTYNETSIKNIERTIKGKEIRHQLQVISSSQMVRQWKIFLNHLGEERDLSKELLDKLEQLSCWFYALQSSVHDVNDCRYHLVCTNKGEIDSHYRPPCMDCLKEQATMRHYH